MKGILKSIRRIQNRGSISRFAECPYYSNQVAGLWRQMSPSLESGLCYSNTALRRGCGDWDLGKGWRGTYEVETRGGVLGWPHIAQNQESRCYERLRLVRLGGKDLQPLGL